MAPDGPGEQRRVRVGSPRPLDSRQCTTALSTLHVPFDLRSPVSTGLTYISGRTVGDRNMP